MPCLSAFCFFCVIASYILLLFLHMGAVFCLIDRICFLARCQLHQVQFGFVVGFLCLFFRCSRFDLSVPIGGDIHTAGAAIAVPLRILGQQPIQNAAPTLTMFIIVIDPFCCNQTLRLGPIVRVLHLHYLFAEPPICRQTAPECTKPCTKFQKISGGKTPRSTGKGKGGREGIIHLLLPQTHTAVAG